MKFHKVNSNKHSYFISEDMKMIIDDDINIPEKFDLRLTDVDLQHLYKEDQSFNVNWTGTFEEMEIEGNKLYEYYKNKI